MKMKAQSSQWKSPGAPLPKKAQQSCSEIKTMLTVVFDWEGGIHHEYVPPGQTINKEYHLNILHQSRDAIWWKWLQLWAPGDWQLHPDIAPARASGLVPSFARHQITQVTQPPCSPDLAPWDFWLFPKLKSPLKGKRFQTVDEIQENTMGQLMEIGRTVWGPKVPTLKGTEASLSYVQCLCPMFLVSCIFFNKCLYFSYYMAS